MKELGYRNLEIYFKEDGVVYNFYFGRGLWGIRRYFER